MEERLPFYMAYQVPLQLDDEKMERRDLEYMKSMYPQMAKRLLPYVEDECDRMEYEGSMIFDEYPDKVQVHLMCGRIFRRFDNEDKLELPESEEIESQSFRRGYRKEDFVRDLIQVMVFQELHRRRCENRRCRRRFY